MNGPLLLLALAASSMIAAEWAPEVNNVRIPMRDGKDLGADVYLPVQQGTYPTVLVQTPYNRAGMGAVLAADAKLGETGRGAASDMKLLLDRERYAYVFVDWRGFHGSKEAMVGVKKLGFKRGQDGFDCVEWIARQPWSNGRVGTWGGSALGKQQLDTAAENPPHLVCCVPLIAAMGQWYGSYYEGGVLLEGHVQRLGQLGFGVAEMVKKNPLGGTPLWNGVEKLTYRPAAMQVPCLFITGWWDNYLDRIIENFDDVVRLGGAQAKSGSKLLIGPWDHVSIGVAAQGDMTFAGASLESARAAKAFLDYWLRDVRDNGWDSVARVRYWPINESTWRNADSWTGMERETRTMVIGKGPATITCDPRNPTPTLGGANLPPMKHGPTDQKSLETRKDVIVFATGPLAKAVRLCGNAELAFTFDADRPDCDFTARLCDVAPDGRVLLLADAAQRAKFRDSLAEAKLLTPGEKYAITVRFPVLAATLPEGHELKVILSCSNSPRYERNTHTGADRWDPDAALPVRVTIHGDVSLRVPELIIGK